MNNNLVKFIDEKMEKLYKKSSSTRIKLVILDTALYNQYVLDNLTEKEIKELKELLHKLENKYELLNEQYDNLNVIRMHVLGLI